MDRTFFVIMIMSLTVLIYSYIALTPYAVTSLVNYRAALAFLPNNNGSTDLNSSLAIGNNSQPSFLKVVVLINDSGVINSPFFGQFPVDIKGPDISPNHFYGSDTGTISRAIPGTYIISISIDGPFTTEFSGNCTGKASEEAQIVIKQAFKYTCMITETTVKY